MAEPPPYVSSMPDPLQALAFVPKSAEEVSQSGLIFLDASVLVEAYQTSATSLAAIERQYRALKLAGRLAVPEHALREFVRRRPSKLRELVGGIEATRSHLRTLAKEGREPRIPAFLHSLVAYKTAEKSISDMDAATAAFQAARQATLAALRALYEEAEGLLDDSDPRFVSGADQVSKIYKDLIDDTVVCASRPDEESILRDAARRRKTEWPPLGEPIDDDKGNGNAEGDLRVWLELLEHAKSTSTERPIDALLVINDTKSNWSKRGVTRPELINEYRLATGGGTIHLVELSRFMSLVEADEAVVQDIVRAETSARARTFFEKDVSTHVTNRALPSALWQPHPAYKYEGPRAETAEAQFVTDQMLSLFDECSNAVVDDVLNVSAGRIDSTKNIGDKIQVVTHAEKHFGLLAKVFHARIDDAIENVYFHDSKDLGLVLKLGKDLKLAVDELVKISINSLHRKIHT